MKFLMSLLLLLSFTSTWADEFSVTEHSFCHKAEYFKQLEAMPTQAGGRVKPLYVLATESMKFIWGKKKFPALASFCDLSFAWLNPQAQINVPVLIEHVDSKKFLQMQPEQTHIDYNELLAKKDLLRSEILQQKENNSYKKDLNKIFTRLDTLTQIIEGKALTFYTVQADGSYDWSGINLAQGSSDAEIENILAASTQKYVEAHGDGHLLELTYVKSHVFSYALLIAIIGIFLTVLLKNLRWPVIVSAVVLLIQISGMVMRVYISGRAPITNMYETVMFSGTGALILSLIILSFRKDKVFLLAGLGYNILCLFMMMFANNMLSSSISPLVPVLRDNFWLSTHVTTIILSYAALALTWLIANISLVKLRLGKLTRNEYKSAQELIYTAMKVGVVLLAAGIILGGVWADYSWGRFWGWDPKETWSLIVLLFYMVIMHGKYTNWFNTHRFVMLSAAGFMTVMMAWFGVNYILASGLHSYGFSEGGAIFLGTFFIVQIAIIIICGIKPRLIDEAK